MAPNAPAPNPMVFNLADLFERVADTVPDRLALVAGERRLTYAQLDERANACAHWLIDAGATPGQHVGIHAHNRAEWVEVMLGCFKARLVPVNVNYRYVVEELRYLFDNADLVALFFETQFAPRIEPVLPELAKLRHLVRISDGTDAGDAITALDYEAALASASSQRDFGPRSPDDHYILYTGGTTGMPKGVMWRAEDIFFAAMGGGNYGGEGIKTPDAIERSVSPAPAVTLALAPLMHGNAQWTMFNAFFGGGTLVLSTDRRFDPEAIWNLVAAESVNTISLVGDAMARPLVDALASAPAPTSLFAIVSGGAILSPTIKTQMHELMPHVLLLDSFGASETGANGVVETTASGPRFHMQASTTVVGDDHRPVAPGETGWLARRGHVPIGYYKDDGKTAATFVEVDGQRWAIPGDLAVLELDGTITVLGRGSQSINSGGEKIFPEEVEAALKSHPTVFDALVVGVPDERWGEHVAAIVEFRPGASATLEELVEHCRTVIADYKVPRALSVVAEIARQPSGKPDYRWAKAVATA
jgi:acyl-CoA synthetase (AMP-forming)/AMP-acid ligase II